ncbi:MAG: hypothetical protein ACFFCW_20765 [Candidatus Hodarchaeota archaeon]
MTNIAKTRLAPNQLIKAKNININVDGEAEVRGGCVKVSTVAFGTNIDRFIHFKTNAYDKIIGYGGTYVKRLDTGVPDVWTALDSSMPDTEDFRSMVIAKDRLYIGAIDATGPRKYVAGQSALWKAGIVFPAVKVTTQEGLSGDLTGTYRHYYTYYNSVTGEESDPSPISDELTVSGKQINLLNFLVSTDPQVDKQRIYRNPNGVQEYYYVGEKNNDTSGFTDNVVDDNLGEEISFRNAPPKKSAILLWHLNRMYYVDNDLPNRIRISEPFLPGSVHADNYVDIEVGDGGKIVALASCYDNIIVFKTSGIFNLIIDKAYPENSDYIPLVIEYGCVSPMAVENIGEDVMFLSPEGLKMVTNSGSSVKDVTILVPTESGKYIDPIANVFRDCYQVNLNKAVGVYYECRDQYCISIPYHTSSNNDMTLVWHRQLGVFTYHEGWNVKATNLYLEYGNKLLYRSHNDQYIYKHDTGFQDDGTNISFEIQSGFNDLTGIPDEKKVRLVFPTIYGTDGTQITHEVIKDFESGGVQRVITHAGASYWGSAHWGQNYWGASGEVLYRHKMKPKGRVFSSRFFGSVNDKIGVAGYQYFFQPKSL